MARPTLADTWPFYVANRPEQPNTDLEVTDKYSGETFARVALAGADDIDRAIRRGLERFEIVRDVERQFGGVFRFTRGDLPGDQYQWRAGCVRVAVFGLSRDRIEDGAAAAALHATIDGRQGLGIDSVTFAAARAACLHGSAPAAVQQHPVIGGFTRSEITVVGISGNHIVGLVGQDA